MHLWTHKDMQTYGRAVGKLQWLTYTRPDISVATKELARDLQQPTQHSLRKVKHLLRCLRGTQRYKMILRTMHTPQTKEPIHLNIYRCGLGRMPKHKEINKWVHRDNDGVRGTIWKQRASSSSTIIRRIRALMQLAQEHIANFIKEATTTRVNIRIHTGSASGKSIATRIGSSKKAKRIDLKYLFIQQLVQSGIPSIHKISTHDNPADILTKYVPAEVLNKHLYMAGIQRPQHHN